MKFQLLVLLFLLSQIGLADKFETPNDTLEAYLQACKEGDYQAAESCYTRSSRELAAQDAKQMGERPPELLIGTYERLKDVDFRLEQVNPKRAILWPETEQIPPMFLRIQHAEEGWRLDYHFMSRYMRVNENGWSWRNQRILDLWKKRQ
ncbi:MAG: hypothetical protein WC314_20380 [Vulcanimicrobiota bacterium]